MNNKQKRDENNRNRRKASQEITNQNKELIQQKLDQDIKGRKQIRLEKSNILRIIQNNERSHKF